MATQLLPKNYKPRPPHERADRDHGGSAGALESWCRSHGGQAQPAARRRGGSAVSPTLEALREQQAQDALGDAAAMRREAAKPGRAYARY